MVIRLDLETVKSQVNCLAAVEQKKLLRIVLGLYPLNGHPNARPRMTGQPRHLVRAQLHGVARGGL
jgi:hypothetical protein